MIQFQFSCLQDGTLPEPSVSTDNNATDAVRDDPPLPLPSDAAAPRTGEENVGTACGDTCEPDKVLANTAVGSFGAVTGGEEVRLLQCPFTHAREKWQWRRFCF